MDGFDLLVLGDANPDLVLTGGDVVPAFGQTERLVDGARLTLGGSGAIMAAGAARLGLRVAFVGVVGSDDPGMLVREHLGARGVDLRGLVVDPRGATGLSVILARTDDRAILTFPGTIGALRGASVPRALLADARHVHVASYFLQRALAQDLPDLLAQRAPGATCSVDPNFDPAGRWDGGLKDLLPRIDVFLPNATEAMAIAGVDDATEAARRLAEATPIVVVKDGAHGAIVAADGVVERVGPCRGVVTVDSTGAGDSFDAGFVAARLAGASPLEAAALADACGAASTRAIGGTDAQPTLEEARALAAGSA